MADPAAEKPVEELRELSRNILDGLTDMLGSPMVRMMVMPKLQWTEREVRDALEYMRGLVTR